MCQSYISSDKRTGLRVVQYHDGKPSSNLPKILVTEPFGHDEYVDFLSVYQAQDKKKIHYYPEGALCWYGCNKYGEPNGVVVYIRDVPIKGLMFAWGLKRKYRMRNFNKKRSLVEVLCEDPKRENWKTVKPRLYQINRKSKKGNKNGNSKRN